MKAQLSQERALFSAFRRIWAWAIWEESRQVEQVEQVDKETSGQGNKWTRSANIHTAINIIKLKIHYFCKSTMNAMKNHLTPNLQLPTSYAGFPCSVSREPCSENWYVDQRRTGWDAMFTFSGKERDEETGYGYFGARYYDSDLSIWLSVDPMASKYPGWSPYNYCLNNPIKLVDPNGEFPFPSRGVNTYFTRANIGIGLHNIAVGRSIRGGITADKHGMTHFSAYSTTKNNNAQTNPASIIVGGGGVSLGTERNFKYDSFVESLQSNSVSINVSAKGLVGGSVGIGEDSFSVGVGLGFELGFSMEPLKLIESISLSKNEAESIGTFNIWTVENISNVKYDENGEPYFEGSVASRNIFGKKDMNISVRSQGVMKDGQLVPNGVWMSHKYRESLETN
ncbi:RHS repeat-associated core domain-containing protein [Bacteroidales bacterium OttesenSCG-928-B11]|nr:RHS repeat-associated core domain-containing protein [Bacteroidales bacterium OttesenSCG-928-B11]